MIAGINLNRFRIIDVDEQFRMKPDELASAMEKDITAGLVPFFCCATLGTTSSGAFDDLSSIGPICNKVRRAFAIAHKIPLIKLIAHCCA